MLALYVRCLYFHEFIIGFNSTMLSVVGDVLIDSEMPMVTSHESSDLSAKSFEGVHRSRICICVFIAVSERRCL